MHRLLNRNVDVALFRRAAVAVELSFLSRDAFGDILLFRARQTLHLLQTRFRGEYLVRIGLPRREREGRSFERGLTTFVAADEFKNDVLKNGGDQDEAE